MKAIEKQKSLILGSIFLFIVAAPIWRSGLRTNMTFIEFIINHTIFSSNAVEYIPEEQYLAQFERYKELTP